MFDCYFSDAQNCEGDGFFGEIFEEGWVPSNLLDELELLNDGANTVGPTTTDWDDVEFKMPTITIDKARREAWNQGKMECSAIRDELQRRLDALRGRNNEIQTMSLQHFAFLKLFGPESS